MPEHRFLGGNQGTGKFLIKIIHFATEFTFGFIFGERQDKNPGGRGRGKY
jgi:hypothetical protein